MKTALQLRTDILADIWPSGEPENLVTSHANHFQEALADISRWVECEQSINVNVCRFCKTKYRGGLTILPAPKGIIRRLYTIANDNWDDPVFYRQTEWPHPEAWARNLYLFPSPLVTDGRKLPLGYQDASSANDSVYGRARTGIWAIWKGNLYLAPWIQSNEAVIIEWDGIKEVWTDTDLVNTEINYRKMVKLYMQFAHERDYGQLDRAAAFSNAGHSGQYDCALADAIFDCRNNTKLRPDMGVPGIERDRLCSELSDDAIVTDADGVTIADLNNLPAAGADLTTLTALVKSWGPDAIVLANVLGGGSDYDATAGLSFFDFLSPYIGNKGAGAQQNGVWPVPAASDWTNDATLAKFFKFFAGPGGLKYYDVVLGDVHLFVLDASSNEPDGTTSGSTQGLWLQGKLATSTAPWKVVKLDLNPFSSVTANAGLQWPFQSWGAHLVISSQTKNYERLSVGGMPFIVNGLGGLATIQPVVTPTVNTQYVYDGGFGAGKLFATTKALLYQFYSEAGNLVDTLELIK